MHLIQLLDQSFPTTATPRINPRGSATPQAQEQHDALMHLPLRGIWLSPQRFHRRTLSKPLAAKAEGSNEEVCRDSAGPRPPGSATSP